MNYCLTLRLATLVLFVLTFQENEVSGLDIAAFNIQVFGRTKVSKPEVVAVLVQIIRRYDIIVIQEIRDSSGTAIVKLLKEVNNAGGEIYEMKLSERLGRGSSKEQYAVLYKQNNEIKPSGVYQSPDPQDKIHRAPFSVHFKLPMTDIGSLVLTVVHVDPDEAPEEIDALADVIRDVGKHFKDENVLVMGDLNADCSYFNKKEKENSELRSKDYHWFIDDDQDTTVSNTDCAYDRFITKSAVVANNIVHESVIVFQFDVEYNLTTEQAKAVSDHYPIEFYIPEEGYPISGASSLGGMLDRARRGIAGTGILQTLAELADHLVKALLN